MVDQPTPPNLGNQLPTEFLQIPEWAVQATNRDDVEDTIDGLRYCVNAVLHRIIRDNFLYLNEALACRVDTPLSLAAKASSGERWRPGDDCAAPVWPSDLTGVGIELPDHLFPFNRSAFDYITPGLRFQNTENPADIRMLYAAANAPGSRTTDPVQVIWGLRNHATRWYWTNSPLVSCQRDQTIVSLQVKLPQWNQANEGCVLLKYAQPFEDPDTGAFRMGFEFGLGPAGNPSTPEEDPAADAQDYVPYVKWYDGNDTEVVCKLSTSFDSLCISPGAEWTLGFHRRPVGEVSYIVDFYINGLLVGSSVTTGPSPATSALSDLRLIVGSDKYGDRYCVGPIRNVAVRGLERLDDPGDVGAFMLNMHRFGAFTCKEIVLPS